MNETLPWYSFARSIRRLLVCCATALLLLFPLIISTEVVPEAHDDMPARCLAAAVYNEARGEPVAGQKAVLEVIGHRAARTGMDYCGVVAKRRQFPWFAKRGAPQLTEEKYNLLVRALTHPPVLKDENYLYFNTIPQPGTGPCRSIGNHVFCKEKHAHKHANHR